VPGSLLYLIHSQFRTVGSRALVQHQATALNQGVLTAHPSRYVVLNLAVALLWISTIVTIVHIVEGIEEEARNGTQSECNSKIYKTANHVSWPFSQSSFHRDRPNLLDWWPISTAEAFSSCTAFHLVLLERREINHARPPDDSDPHFNSAHNSRGLSRALSTSEALHCCISRLRCWLSKLPVYGSPHQVGSKLHCFSRGLLSCAFSDFSNPCQLGLISQFCQPFLLPLPPSEFYGNGTALPLLGVNLMQLGQAPVQSALSILFIATSAPVGSCVPISSSVPQMLLDSILYCASFQNPNGGREMLPNFRRALCILHSSFAPFQGPPKHMNLGCTAFLGLLFPAECFSRATVATDVAVIPSAFHQFDTVQQPILSTVLPIAGSDRLLPCFLHSCLDASYSRRIKIACLFLDTCLATSHTSLRSITCSLPIRAKNWIAEKRKVSARPRPSRGYNFAFSAIQFFSLPFFSSFSSPPSFPFFSLPLLLLFLFSPLLRRPLISRYSLQDWENSAQILDSCHKAT
jgi:hypothetical protein